MEFAGIESGSVFEGIEQRGYAWWSIDRPRHARACGCAGPPWDVLSAWITGRI